MILYFFNDIPYIFHIILIHCWLEYSFMLTSWLMDWPTWFFWSTAWWPAKNLPLGGCFLVTNVTNLSTGKSWGHRFGGGFWPHIWTQGSLASSSFAWWSKIHHLIHGSHTITNYLLKKKQNQSMFGNSSNRDSNVFLDIFVMFLKTMVAMVVTSP